jgi:DNA-binding NtrC family response regulator
MAELLAVDDEPEWLRLYEQVLSEEGHVLRCVADGREAIRDFEKRPADAVILDIRMAPSGRDVMRAIRRMRPDVPIIVSSAYAGYRTDPDFEKADAFLVKSGDPQRLRAAVRDVLERRGPSAGGARQA